MNKKVALICGVSGQDGGYLASFLVNKGYEVWETSRVAEGVSFLNLLKLCVKEKIRFLSMLPEEFRSVLVALRKSQPVDLYYLAGQ
ncbi:MAG: GDPmannose 4,6-dehydratase [Psychroserpens sp.]|jgi:GDPmannose 4,6-dehydratase